MSIPAFPVNELVTQQIAGTVLAKLLAAPASSGYNTQLSAIERWRHQPANVPANLKAVVWGGDDDPMGDDKTNTGQTAWKRAYGITVYYAIAESDPTPPERAGNIIGADIAKVMLAEIKNGTNFNNLVQNCWHRGNRMGMESSEILFVNVFFDIYYRTSQYDPYIDN